jgi:hypothetical protein
VLALVVEHRGPEEQQHAREHDGDLRHAFESLGVAGAGLDALDGRKTVFAREDFRVNRAWQNHVFSQSQGRAVVGRRRAAGGIRGPQWRGQTQHEQQ